MAVSRQTLYLSYAAAGLGAFQYYTVLVSLSLAKELADTGFQVTPHSGKAGKRHTHERQCFEVFSHRGSY